MHPNSVNPGDILIAIGMIMGIILVVSAFLENARRKATEKAILDAVAKMIGNLREENRKTHAGLCVKVDKLIEQADRGILDEAFRIADGARDKRKNKQQKGKK